MTKDELIELRQELDNECIRRRQLGDYNTDAYAILNLFRAQVRTIDHLIDNLPKTKKK